MKFGGLDIQNFMSVRNATTTLSDRGLMLIQGKNDDADAFESNGSGKSTIFSDSIVWALFGETIRGQKGDKVINRHVGKNTRVKVEIIDDNGDQYEIIRHRKHKEHKNHVHMFRNGKNITSKSDKDTDKQIEQMLEMDFLSFTNSIMFGQGLSKMFAVATDSEQKKIMERMLQIDVFRACQERAKQYLAQTEKSLDESNTILSGLQDKKQTLEKSVEDLQTKEAELQGKVTARIKELQNQIENHLNEIDNLDDVEDLQHDKGLLQQTLDKVQSKLDEFEEFVNAKNTLTGDERALKREYDNLERKLTNEVRKLRDIKNGRNVPKICSECGQNLPSEDTSHLEKHLEDSIEELEKQSDEKMNELTETRQLLNDVEKVLEGRKKYEDNKSEVEQAIRDIDQAVKDRNQSEKYHNDMIKHTEDLIKEQEEMLGTTYTGLIEDTIKEIGQVDEQIDYKMDQITGYEKDKDDYNFWANAFGNQGIKSVLLDSVVPFLNKRANYYLSKLASSSIEVRFNTQTTLKSGDKRDKFSVEVINKNGDDDYKGNSGGEKRRVDIAVNMALQDLVSSRSNKRIDLIVYDECFEGLDNIGCEGVIQLLQEKAMEFGSVMVITHNDGLKQLFNQTITVSKSGGSTKISYDE